MLYVVYVLITVALQQSLKSGRLIPPVPFFFLKIALAIRGFLYFHTKCEIICSSSAKNTIGSLIGSYIKLQCVCGFIRVLSRNRTNKKIFIQEENHDEKLAHRIMEAEKSPNLCNQSAGDPEKLTVQFQFEGMKIRRAGGINSSP